LPLITPEIDFELYACIIGINTSKWLNEEKFQLKKFGWQDGYSAFTVSKSQVEKGSSTFGIRRSIIARWTISRS